MSRLIPCLFFLVISLFWGVHSIELLAVLETDVANLPNYNSIVTFDSDNLVPTIIANFSSTLGIIWDGGCGTCAYDRSTSTLYFVTNGNIFYKVDAVSGKFSLLLKHPGLPFLRLVSMSIRKNASLQADLILLNSIPLPIPSMCSF